MTNDVSSDIFKKKCKDNGSVYNNWYEEELQQSVETANIYKLNNDCLMLIFLYLPIIDRIRIERVCKRWLRISQKSWYNIKKLELTNSVWGFSSDVKLKQINTIILDKVLSRCGRFLNEIHLDKTFCEGRESALAAIGSLCPNIETIDVSCLQIWISYLK